MPLPRPARNALPRPAKGIFHRIDGRSPARSPDTCRDHVPGQPALPPLAAGHVPRVRSRRVEPKPASESRAVLVRWMGTGDANSAGFVHGGVVMKLCDEAAGVAAIRHCRGRVVTAAMDRMTFILPVNVGELLTCSASVSAAWRTSMEVGVRVEAENPRSGERRHTS